jgi:hypothetical protein
MNLMWMRSVLEDKKRKKRQLSHRSRNLKPFLPFSGNFGVGIEDYGLSQ